MKRLYLTIVLSFLILASITSTAQKYNLRFVNDSVSANKLNYYLTVQIQAPSVSDLFTLGNSNLTFDYNANALSVSLATAITKRHNFSGGFYSMMTLTNPIINSGGVGTLSINIEYNSAPDPTFATSVSTTWISIMSIRFNLLNANLCGNFAFRSPSAPAQPCMLLDGTDTDIPRNSITNFTACPLPVELLFFTAQPSGNDALLDWATASEINNMGFDVQRYNDIRGDWDVLKTVFSKAPQGTSFSKLYYDFTDKDVYNPGMGTKTFYYRLRQIDFNNESEYSEVKSVTFNSKTLPGQVYVHLFPNPASETVFLEIFNAPTSDPYEVTFFDKYGKAVLTNIIHTKGFIDIRNLPQGSYNLSIKNEKTFIKNSSLIISR